MGRINHGLKRPRGIYAFRPWDPDGEDIEAEIAARIDRNHERRRGRGR
ncbi:MAG TPA: hypothetical protein PKJ51_04850 [Methanothrix sp.]|nr:hypothetical protein [Methanothrix sp.]